MTVSTYTRTLTARVTPVILMMMRWAETVIVVLSGLTHILVESDRNIHGIALKLISIIKHVNTCINDGLPAPYSCIFCQSMDYA